MPAFFLTFLSVALVTLAGREAVRVARLAEAGISVTALLLAAAFGALAFAVLASTIGGQIAPLLNANGKQLILAIALALAAFEVLFMKAGKAPREPTLSVGAVALVLGGALVTGGAGLLVMAFTLATGNALLAGAGGAVGALTALAIAIVVGSEFARPALSKARYFVAALLVTAALRTGVPVLAALG